jgi:transcriptional regulator with XRE-family HTH domain
MKELGKHIGLAESTVSLYERNLHEPDLDTLRSLSAIFSVTVDYLLGNDVPGHVPAQENAPAPDARAEAKQLLEGLSDDQYQAALQYLQFLKTQKG